MILDPQHDWVPSHGVLDSMALPSASQIGGAAIAPVPFVQPFTLAHHFTRGGYPGSLRAGSASRARQWRERWLREELPLLPLDQGDTAIDPLRFGRCWRS